MPPDSGIDYKFYAYLLISLALAVPVFMWPLVLHRDIPQTFYPLVVENWMVASAVLLMAAVVADSVLAGAARLRNVLSASVWTIGAGMLVAYALRVETGAYLLAAAFAVHSLRSATALWRGEAGWWRWPAWARDAGVAVSLFGWLLSGVP